MEISVEKKDQGVILSPSGDVDLSSSRELQQSVKKAMEGKPERVIVDLTNVPYMDSSGVATLVQGLQAMDFASRCALFCLYSGIGDSFIFSVAEFDEVRRLTWQYPRLGRPFWLE